MEKKAGRARKCRACAVGAFGDDIVWGHILQVQPGEVEGLATDREKWNKTWPQVAPLQALSCPTPHCLPGSSLNRRGNLRGRKNRTVQIRVLSSPLWGCRPLTQGQRSGHLKKETDRNCTWGAGSWEPSSTTVLPSSSLMTFFFPLPTTHLATTLTLTQNPEHRLRCQLLSIKGVCLYSKQAAAHSESAHSKAAHVTAPPAQSPSGTDANLWLETLLNMSLAQRVRFPGLLCPERPRQDFRR